MENATKALIIAAAILIAIVLISLGVFVLNMGANSAKSVNLNEQEQMAFNSKFSSYEGRQRGSQVNALAQAVITSNQAQDPENGGNSCFVSMDASGKGFGTIEAAADSGSNWRKVNAGEYYTVTFTYTSGLISAITVE